MSCVVGAMTMDIGRGQDTGVRDQETKGVFYLAPGEYTGGQLFYTCGVSLVPIPRASKILSQARDRFKA